MRPAPTRRIGREDALHLQDAEAPLLCGRVHLHQRQGRPHRACRESIETWAKDPEHQIAKRKGRELWYSHSSASTAGETRTTENKRIVERYLDGFRKSDHEQILSCLTEDVEWEMPGAFHLVGKPAFDKEIENDAFVGRPTITTTRMVEENDVVVVEGRVRAKRKDGGVLNAVFCDVLVMSNARIRRLTTYLAEVKSE